MQPDERKESMLKLVERTGSIYLGTVFEGAPRIKVVTKNIHDGLKAFRFVTLTHRQRTLDIQKDGRACLYFADNENYITLRLDGMASISRDPEILGRMWNDGMKMFFKEGVADPEYSAIEFRAEGGNFYHWPHIGNFVLNGEEIVWKDWVKHE
jgi:general stress protein 26